MRTSIWFVAGAVVGGLVTVGGLWMWLMWYFYRHWDR